MNKQNRKGWYNDPRRHYLASKGIKTSLTKFKEDKGEKLPEDWLENRIEAVPHKKRFRGAMGDVYDEIKKKLEEGEYVIDGHRVNEVDEEHNTLFVPFIDQSKFLTKSQSKSVGKYSTPSFNEWLAYHLERIFEPLKEWIDKEYNLDLDFYARVGGVVAGFSIGWEGERASREHDWVQEEYGEQDLHLIDEVSEVYPRSKNKRDFKNTMMNWANIVLAMSAEDTYDKIRTSIKNGKLAEIEKQIKGGEE